MMLVFLVTMILVATIKGNSTAAGALQVSVVTSPAGPTYKAGSLYSIICQASNGIPPYSYAWSIGCSYSNTMSNYFPYINILGPYVTTLKICMNRYNCRVTDSTGGTAVNETIIKTVTDIAIHLQTGIDFRTTFSPRNISILTTNESGRFFEMVCASGLRQPNLGKWIHPNGTEIFANNKYMIQKGGGTVSLPYYSLTLKQGYSLTAPYDYGLYRCRMLDIEMVERESHIWILKEQSFNSAIPEYFRSHSGTDLVTLYCGYSNTPGEITWSIGGVTLNNNEVYQTSQRLLQTDPVLYEGVVDIKTTTESLIMTCTTRSAIIGNAPNQSPFYEVITSAHYFFLQFVGQSQPITCSFSRTASTIVVSLNGVVLLSATNTTAISFQTSVGDATHNRMYTCIGTFEDAPTSTFNFTIVALIPPYALTMHVEQSESTEAGKALILDLSAIKITGFTYEQSLSCTNNNGMPISQLDGFDYPQNPTLTGLTLHHRVTINNVKLSHAGLYFCKATLETLPQLDNITDYANFTITVKIPAPVIMLTNQTTTRTGGVGEFDCIVSLNSSYIDVPLQPDIHWMFNGEEVNNNRYNIMDTVTLTNSSNNIVYYSKLEIIPLMKEDESTITCSASLYNPSSYIINSPVSQSSLLLAIEACPLCDPGYSITTNSSGCYCVLSDICMTQPSPCNNNGSCTLTSPPDNFTCNCTGIGYTGDTCDEACLSSCSDGYTLNSTSCTCYITNICLANNPCNNNGSCTLTSPPDDFTCNCTGTGFIGDTCEDCSLTCQPGYSIITNSSGCYCVLSDICMTQPSPCNNNGSCTLTSPPDNFTCNYTGTGYTGDTRETCPSCDPGYSITTNSSGCYCVLRDICMTQPSPCNNNGSCTLSSPPDSFTCNCTGTGYTGDTCEVFPDDEVALGIPKNSNSSSINLTPAEIFGYIVVPASLFVVLLLFLSAILPLFWYRWKRKFITVNKKRKLKSASTYNEHTITTTNNIPMHSHYNSEQSTSFKHCLNPTDSELQVSAKASLPSSCLIELSDLKVLEKVGQGEFGIVYRGVLTKHEHNEQTITPVAIKTVKRICSQSQLADHLIDEAEKMVHFNHFNVLSLTGVCFGLLESPCIVMPFMSNGSLLSYLRKESANLTVFESADENLILDTTKQLLSMCLQVAKGMVYLTDQKFVHRDLAARNCMISSDGVIKVADFGLAEDVYTSGYFKLSSDLSKESVKLPIKWMALESIHLEIFNEKTDVWSYGVLCWEVFSIGRMPYAGISPKELIELLDSGERLIKPNTPTSTDEIYSLIESCWYKSPEKRPHFTDIVDSVEQLMIPLAEYIDFNLSHNSQSHISTLHVVQPK